MTIALGPKIPAFVSGAEGDTYWPQGNQLLRMLQALVQPNVVNLTTTAPPIAPNNGDTYVVAVGGSGAWTGHDNQIAYWTTDDPQVPAGKWEFWPPENGWLVSDRSTNPPTIYQYNGATWAALTSNPFTPAGNGLFYGGQGLGLGFDTTASPQSSATPNEVRVAQTLIPFPVTVQDIVFGFGGGHVNIVVGFALYSMDGNTKVLEGIFSMASVTAITYKITLGAPVTVPAGSYYFAWAANGVSVGLNYGLDASVITNNLNETYVRVGTAANPFVSSGTPAMPATLGALTAGGFDIVAPFFEN